MFASADLFTVGERRHADPGRLLALRADEHEVSGGHWRGVFHFLSFIVPVRAEVSAAHIDLINNDLAEFRENLDYLAGLSAIGAAYRFYIVSCFNLHNIFIQLPERER